MGEIAAIQVQVDEQSRSLNGKEGHLLTSNSSAVTLGPSETELLSKKIDDLLESINLQYVHTRPVKCVDS